MCAMFISSALSSFVNQCFAKNALKAIFHAVHLEMSLDGGDKIWTLFKKAMVLMMFVGYSPLNRSDHADHFFSYEKSYVRIVEKDVD